MDQSFLDKLKSIGKGAAIAGAGAALAYMAGEGAMGAALAAVLVNAVRKLYPDFAKLLGFGKSVEAPK